MAVFASLSILDFRKILGIFFPESPCSFRHTLAFGHGNGKILGSVSFQLQSGIVGVVKS